MKTIASQRDACQAKFSEATILVDFTPMKGLSLGPVAIQPQSNGQLVGGTRARWFIPARIEPKVYGQREGAVYYHTDAAENLKGPFVPGVVR